MFLTSFSKLHATSGVYFRSRTIPFDPFEFCCSRWCGSSKNLENTVFVEQWTTLLNGISGTSPRSVELSQIINCVVTHVDPIHNENAQTIHENAANCDY